MHVWIWDHIEWVLTALITSVLAIVGWIAKNLNRLSALEGEVQSIKEDQADAKSARVEQMKLMQAIQADSQRQARMLERIDERTSRDYKDK